MMSFSKGSFAGVLLGFVISASSYAFIPNAVKPDCLDGNQEIGVDNERVIDLKKSTRNGAQFRALVKGRLSKAPWIQNKHVRFIINIGPNPKDQLEVVYNLKFGSMPQISSTAEVVVCGDFINSFKQNGQYKASPAGAIIHWVHYNPGTRDQKHEHGYIMVDDKLIGFDEADNSAWQGDIKFAPLRSERAHGDWFYEPNFDHMNNYWDNIEGRN